MNINYKDLINSLEKFVPVILPIDEVLNGTYSSQEIVLMQNQYNTTSPREITRDIENILTYVEQKIIFTHFIQYLFIGILFILWSIYQFLMKRQLLQINQYLTEKMVLNQLCHEMRSSLVPIEMYTRELLVKINGLP